MNILCTIVCFLIIIKCYNAQQVILDKVEAVVGQKAELPCNVTAEKEEDNRNVLVWYKNGSATAFYSRDFRDNNEGTIGSLGGRYQMVTSQDTTILEIKPVRPADAGVYHCTVEFASSPTQKAYIQLQVIEPPQRLWVVHKNGSGVATTPFGVNTSTDIGPYYIGDVVHLYCVAFEGKPQPSVSWWSADRMLKNTWTPLSKLRARSDLEFGPLQREDHGRVLTCFASNHESCNISSDVVLDMHLSPELVSVRALGENTGGRVKATEVLALQCRVLGARPTPDIVWRVGDGQLYNLEQNITKETSQRLVVSEIQLTVDRQYDESIVTCCASAHTRDADLVCAPGLPLTVTYVPVVNIVSDSAIENNTIAINKGSSLTINCTYQANPSVYQLIWFREGDILNNNEETYQDLNTSLNLTDLNEENAGEYVCSVSNDEGTSYSEPLVIDVTYPAYCEDDTISEYGLGENESMNVTCKVISNPPVTGYRWVLVNEASNVNTLRLDEAHRTIETQEATLLYRRPNNTAFSTIFCWGLNNVMADDLPNTPCTFLVTDETVPQPPLNCKAKKNPEAEIAIECEKGHDGGLLQKFSLTVKSETGEQLTSITNLEPKFIIQEPTQEKYIFVILASNEKGDSSTVEINKDGIIEESIVGETARSAVSNITTLALALCGGVLLVALAACGLVLCAHERAPRRDLPRATNDPPLCAYNTEESNCETYNDSEDGSECNVRRTDSFRRAMSRYPSQNYDVRRASSFHSTRFLHDPDQEGVSKCSDVIRHNPTCRVHSMHNISRKRDMDVLCDHLVAHLPHDTGYSAPKTMNSFYTMPRKNKQKSREISDETSEITQSDAFSLPPPPDEFTSYRAGPRIKDIPKPPAAYSTIIRKNSSSKEPIKYSNAMNTVRVPTISGNHNNLYNYPDDDDHRNTNPFEDTHN